MPVKKIALIRAKLVAEKTMKVKRLAKKMKENDVTKDIIARKRQGRTQSAGKVTDK
jgi:hypothetical protein